MHKIPIILPILFGTPPLAMVLLHGSDLLELCIIILYISSKNFIRDDTEATIGDKLNSFDETLVHAASETAFVTFWSCMAYLIFEFGMISIRDIRSRSFRSWIGIGAVLIA